MKGLYLFFLFFLIGHFGHLICMKPKEQKKNPVQQLQQKRKKNKSNKSKLKDSSMSDSELEDGEDHLSKEMEEFFEKMCKKYQMDKNSLSNYGQNATEYISNDEHDPLLGSKNSLEPKKIPLHAKILKIITCGYRWENKHFRMFWQK